MRQRPTDNINIGAPPRTYSIDLINLRNDFDYLFDWNVKFSANLLDGIKRHGAAFSKFRSSRRRKSAHLLKVC
jgi:hypothetical protein